MEKIVKLPVVGYEDFYLVDDKGNIYSLHKSRFGKNKNLDVNKPLSAHTDKNGYVSVVLVKNKEKRTNKLHRVVALAFVPNPENKPCVNHINRIKTDNRVGNLEWVTYSENEIHSVEKLGKTTRKGENSPIAKLNDNIVLEIKKEMQKGEASSNIARMFNVSPQLICCIKKGRKWSHVKLPV